MNDDNLATESVDSLSTGEGNVESPNNPMELDMSMDAMIASLRSQGEIDGDYGVADEPVEEPQVEEELDDDTADATHIEADETDEEDEVADPTEEVNEAAEIDVLTYDDLFEQVKGIEIGGEVYSPAQLKSILGQEKAAGTKAREAAETIKALDAQKAELDKRAQWLDRRQSASVQSDEMVRLQKDYAKLQSELESYTDVEENLYEIGVTREKMNRVSAQYQAVKKEVDEVQQAHRQEQKVLAAEGLKERGLEFLTKKGPQADAWVSYAKDRMDPSVIEDVVVNPALAEMVEKARRWDAANGKEGKKLTSKSPALKSTGHRKPSKGALEKQLVERVRNGTASPTEIEQYLMQDGRNLLTP